MGARERCGCSRAVTKRSGEWSAAWQHNRGGGWRQVLGRADAAFARNYVAWRSLGRLVPSDISGALEKIEVVRVEDWQLTLQQAFEIPDDALLCLIRKGKSVVFVAPSEKLKQNEGLVRRQLDGNSVQWIFHLKFVVARVIPMKNGIYLSLRRFHPIQAPASVGTISIRTTAQSLLPGE
jgi:hypothetical protein